MATTDLLHLTVFREVARLGSMSKAAAFLQLAQPTVSGRISELEADLGVTLFDRSSRGAELTAGGHRFLGNAERMLALYSEGRKEAQSEAARQQIRLAAPASLAEMLFADLAAALVERGFDVSLSNDHSPRVIEMLLDGRIDIGFCGITPTTAAIAAVALDPIPISCIASSDHPLADEPSRSYGLAEIASHGLALFEWAEAAADLRERVRIAVGQPSLTGIVKASPAGVARRLVLNGAAACFVPEPIVARDLEARRVVRLLPRGVPDYRWDVMLVHRASDTEDQAIAEVGRLLRGGTEVPAERSANRGR